MKSRTFLVMMLVVVTSPLAAQTSAVDTWRWLMQGNEQFVNGPDLVYRDIVGQRRSTANEQRPRATIVACADSRVPPELIFNKTLGELFVVRVAGNVVDEFALASMEFAGSPVSNWSRLIVILGHSGCGAVQTALGPGQGPTEHLTTLLTRIRESFSATPYATPITNGEPPSPTILRTATEANALHVAAYIRAHSFALRQAERNGSVEIYAAYHDLESGRVTRVMPVPPR